MAPNHRPDETTPDPESGPAAAPERTAPTPAAPASGPERTSAPASASSAASTPVPALEADLCLSRGAFTLEASLTVRPGEILALLGPNGAGKSSALRALAGLVPLTGGRVLVDGRDQTRTPVEHRPIGMVFQDYLLFPHMSALDNVAFGPRHQGLSRAGARERAAELLAHMDLSAYARVRPRRLSGGQAQRVALARALAVRPRLLLLDEPMAALDASTRIDVRARLGHLLEEFDGATVLVTHDPLDAMVLADRVAVIEGGRVVQQGEPAEVARRPRTAYVARLVGLNLFRGTAEGTTVTLDGDGPGGPVRVEAHEAHRGPALVAFPPRAVALYPHRPHGSPRNVWRLTVEGIERFGDQVRVHLAGNPSLAADISPAALAELGLARGDAVWAGVKAAEVECYPG
ncbi:ABC transporter ATP-binding protein [Nocardiopsis dassonvillei]|uniref:ABC-type quaternary amine transporter n=1 Tax=Nocardiopsis dassonvillei (strain ATCC 23218 / DSM 43111 / CIP 107115 / JCM 7437 / KCTC 9190 / NBRC 14626 / NCTC 10488 / NRRL B-5397 / IMRU 509) TaxID=446468 RepID=D7AXS2_NOCDD|nr:ABC transporter ATP-binding protein [Nocardiopsis dassonvillei]ADH67976.1 ABC transporter related protein [Nocardiopsis dassonvillei subsp. dassonvillei DSM 43111]VEI88475.1 Spermidine/putrescine import ATP-binding protein PotA [Nocardiopsis dassonvillei]